jgi:outer membrane biosynthesis protein TonB
LSDIPGEVSPEAKSKLILLPTKKEADRVLYLVHEVERYRMAINISERELKELSKKPELASLARSYRAALTGRQKKPPSSEKKEKEKKGDEKKEGKEDKQEPPVQLSPRPLQPPTPKKTASQKRREKEKKKKAEDRRLKDQEKFDLALAVRNSTQSSSASSGSLFTLGANHPMLDTGSSTSSSSSSSSSLPSSSSTNMTS